MHIIINKISKKFRKLCLRPINVYCLHHVCEQFDGEWMNECDWMPIEDFKRKVLACRINGVEFISLMEAYGHIRHDRLRFKKYAVITFDDGYATLNEILPWLRKHNIPVTLFVNPDYAAGIAYRITPKEQYLSVEELSQLKVDVGMHGLQHIDVSKMSEKEFAAYSSESIEATSKFVRFVPFWAYTWGLHNSMTDGILQGKAIIPVLIDGMKNYNDFLRIHRELL